MRSISQTLRDKLLERWQADSKNAKPNLRLIATQATINTLISEPIHDDISSAFGDVALRQLPGEKSLSLAYAICIDNGIAKIYERTFPADLDNPWSELWTLGSAKDVAIEFSGVWTIEARRRWYELITDETPYIFYVDNNNELFVQRWMDTTTKTSLATGVSQISVCRGWQSKLDTGVDQGLIIGYLRGGKVYYRAYCQQIDGQYLWESENEITQLGTGNTTLCVFRTNDFRVGFISENGGEMKYVLSQRTYAGQAMPPEYANAQMQDSKVWQDAVAWFYPIAKEYAKCILEQPYVACYDATTLPLQIVESQRIGTREIIIIFNRNIDGISGAFINYFTTFPVREVATCVWQNGNQLKLILTQDLGQSVALDLIITECHEAWQYIGNQKMPIEAMTLTVPGDPLTTILNETVAVAIEVFAIRLDIKNDNNRYFNETATVVPQGSIELYPIGVIPI